MMRIIWLGVFALFVILVSALLVGWVIARVTPDNNDKDKNKNS